MKPAFVVIDTETTGLGHLHSAQTLGPNGGWIRTPSPREDEIVQVAIAWRDPKTEAVKTFASYAKPHPRYLADDRAEVAFNITGISKVLLAAAPPVSEIASRLNFILHDLGKPPLRAFNMNFDRPFLARSPWKCERFAWGPCIMLEAQDVLGSTKWPKLTEAAAHFGIPIMNAHDAEADAVAALHVAERLHLHESRRETPEP